VNVTIVEEHPSCGFNQSALIFVSSSTRPVEAGPKMRIDNAEDARSLVRKYFLGTRTFHGKIVTLTMEEKAEGPDDKGAWKVNGTYLTEAGVREQFEATVSSRGEVLTTSSSSTKPKPPPPAILKYGRRHTKVQRGPR